MPPPIPPPPDLEQQRFTSALFSIYYYANRTTEVAKVEVADQTRGLVRINQAALDVANGAQRFGDVWRVLAIAQLAAADIKNKTFQAVIVTLAGNKRHGPRILDSLLAAHPGAERRERERIVYEFLIGPKTFLTLTSTSQPDCPHTYPSVDTTDGNGVATATVTAWVQKPLTDLAANMDPQNWDNSCGSLFFNAAYLTDVKCDGTFDLDKTTYNAAPGKPEPIGQTWGSRYLFEYFIPGAGSNLFKNILSVKTHLEPDSYSVKFYDLEMSIRSRIAPDPEIDGGLLEDKGDASASLTSSPWTLIQGSKTIRFDTLAFPSQTPDKLSEVAAIALKMLGNGFAYWVCCPK